MKIARKLLMVIGVLVLIPVVAIAALSVSARNSDGPSGVFAGGRLVAGELVTGPEPDWTFVRDYSTVEFQLLDPVRSRTTWIMEHEGRIFIPSGYMNSFLGKVWKHWPKEAEEDGRVLLRVDGKLYERQMVRIRDEAVATPVLSELGRKYVGGAPIPFQQVASGDIWLFELRPRS